LRSICFVKLEISIFEKMGHFRNVNLNGTTTKPNLLLEELGSSTIACLSTKPWTIISRGLSWNVEAWRLIERQWHMIIKNRHSQNIEYFFIDWFSNSVSKDKITYQCKIHSNFKKKSNFLNRDRPRDQLRPWKKNFFLIDSDSVFHADHFGILFLKIRPLEPFLDFFGPVPGPLLDFCPSYNIKQKHSQAPYLSSQWSSSDLEVWQHAFIIVY